MSKTATQCDVIEIARTFRYSEDLTVGSIACLLRGGRPWRLVRILEADAETLTTENGYVYARDGGRRLVPNKPSRDELHALTRDRLDYMLVLEFVERAAKLHLGGADSPEIRRLLPLALNYFELTSA